MQASGTAPGANAVRAAAQHDNVAVGRKGRHVSTVLKLDIVRVARVGHVQVVGRRRELRGQRVDLLGVGHDAVLLRAARRTVVR